MKNSAGFTLVELIVTITLVGILVGSLVPTFNSLTNRTQKQVNLANMETIKNTFMQYYLQVIYFLKILNYTLKKINLMNL